MREIEFRGKNIHTRKFVYGSLLDFSKLNNCPQFEIYASDEITKEQKYYKVYDVGQYTGLKDKNGAKIYEGDIAKMHYFFEDNDIDSFGRFENEAEVTGKVFINEYGSGVTGEYSDFYFHDYIEEPSEELEVIGNIYDNLELLNNHN